MYATRCHGTRGLHVLPLSVVFFFCRYDRSLPLLLQLSPNVAFCCKEDSRSRSGSQDILTLLSSVLQSRVGTHYLLIDISLSLHSSFCNWFETKNFLSAVHSTYKFSPWIATTALTATFPYPPLILKILFEAVE